MNYCGMWHPRLFSFGRAEEKNASLREYFSLPREMVVASSLVKQMPRHECVDKFGQNFPEQLAITRAFEKYCHVKMLDCNLSTGSSACIFSLIAIALPRYFRRSCRSRR